MKDKDLRDMSRADLEDEVMLLRAKCKVLENELSAIKRNTHKPGVMWKGRYVTYD